MTRTFLGALALASAIAVGALGAPKATLADTQGFAFGVGLHTNHVDTDADRDDAPQGSLFVEGVGAGGALWIGYGFTPSFAARLFLSGAEHSTSNEDIDIVFGGGTIEAMYLFRDTQPIRPCIVGGLGRFVVSSRVNEYDYETSGPGMVVGAGLACFFGETFAIDFGLRGEFINWEEARATRRVEGGPDVTVETPIEEDGAAGKIVLEATWWL